MKRLILILLMSFITNLIIGNISLADEIKFIQVADSHFSLQNKNSKQVLINAIEDINKQSGISFVIFTGDNLDSPKPVDLKEYVQIINNLKIPYYLVIGNHDVSKSNNLSKDRFIEIIKENNFLYGPSKPNYVFKKDGFVFIIVDGAKEVIPGSVGYYKKDTLDWLDKNLVKYKDKPVVIFQHFPLIEPKVVSSHKTHQAEVYLNLLNKHDNVISVISGHYHLNHEIMQNGIYHVSSPSLLGEPNVYKIINIITTKGFSPMIYTELKEFEQPKK